MTFVSRSVTRALAATTSSRSCPEVLTSVRVFVVSADEQCELLAIDLAVAERLRQGLPSVEDLDRTAARMRGLSDPTRLRLAIALRAGGELCVCDLAWLAERQDKIVSHHLRLLRTAGLVRSRKDGRMVLYSLTDLGTQLLHDVLAHEATA